MDEPSQIGRLARDERGSALLSYALLIFMVGLVMGAGASIFGVTLQDLIGRTTGTIDDYVNTGSSAPGGGN